MIAFSGGCINAEAALPASGQFVSAVNLGISSVEVEYNGNQSVSCPYAHYENIYYFDNPTDYMSSGRGQCVYAAYIGQQLDFSQGVKVRITAPFSVLHTDYLYTYASCFAYYSVSSAAYNAPSVAYFDNVTGAVHRVASPSVGGVYPRIGIQQPNCLPAIAEIDLSISGDISVLEFTFYGCALNPSDYTLIITIGDFYCSSGATAQTGTIPQVPAGWDETTTTTETTSSSGSGNVNVNVDVDMTETNTILEGISGILSGLVESIASLFVPDSEWVQAWITAVKGDLTEIFGAYGAASSMLQQAFDTLLNGSSVASVYFPPIRIPNLSGGVFELYAGGLVPLSNDVTRLTVSDGLIGSASFEDYAKYAIDIAATFAVINSIMKRVKAVLVGETVVELDNEDG